MCRLMGTVWQWYRCSAERLGVELVDEALARVYRLEGPVHARGVDPVKMDAVGMAGPCC